MLDEQRDKLKQIRESRNALRDEFFNENAMGKRLQWAMETLKISGREIERQVGMPETSLRRILLGARYRYYEELKFLADFLNQKYIEKFSDYSRTYQSKPVRKITIMWLMFGYDSEVTTGKRVMELLEKDYQERELKMIEEKWRMEREIETLKNQVKNLNRIIK